MVEELEPNLEEKRDQLREEPLESKRTVEARCVTRGATVEGDVLVFPLPRLREKSRFLSKFLLLKK